MPSKKLVQFYKWLCIAILGLIALGGSVRAMNAGLACPDWPLCFGDVIPDYHPQVYFEFLHRVFAGLIAMVSVAANIYILRKVKVSAGIKVLCWSIFVLLIAQIVMGGLTVLWQLHAKVVTAHLFLGTSYFLCSLWIYLSLKQQREPQEGSTPHWMKSFSMVTFLVIFTQLLLGGLVASHYAALVCTDFPLCHGQLIPTFKGIVGLQVIHRLGAYVTALVILAFAFFYFKGSKDRTVSSSVKLLVGLVFVQIGLGIANILLYTPPLITVLHLTVGVSLLGVSLKIYFFQCRMKQESSRKKLSSVIVREEMN